MKTLFFVFVFLHGNPVFAGDLFAGHWAGVGSLDSNEQGQTAPIQMEIQIEQTEKQLIIHDCWQTVLGSRCYDSNYDINENSQIFEKDHKIGDIFPQDIVIFNGNEQASEQMVFQLNGKGWLRYRYTFSTYDGIMETRFGSLEPK